MPLSQILQAISIEGLAVGGQEAFSENKLVHPKEGVSELRKRAWKGIHAL